MRYADGGGLTAEGRARREKVRLQAAEMFAQDADPVQIARSLRVSTKSVYQWRRAWRAGGEEALASKGPGGSPCRLDEAQLAAAARRAGGRPGRARLGPGPAVDPGPGRGAGRAAVRGLLHAARDVVPAAPDRLLAPGPASTGRSSATRPRSRSGGR